MRAIEKTISQNVRRILVLSLALAFLLLHASACRPSPRAVPTPTFAPTKPPTPLPTVETAPPTATITPPSPLVTYNQAFLDGLGTDPESCLPDKTSRFAGVTIYDLDDEHELVSINADTPFQFASAFKGPLLTYFLESCEQIWNPEDPAWETHALETAPQDQNNWYQSRSYRQRLAAQIYNPAGWGEIEAFSVNNRPLIDGETGPIDTRYFILHQVYNMVTESNNVSAGNVLNYVFENCLEVEPNSEAACGGPNALTEYNAWFNRFAGIEYNLDETRRGLFNWDKLLEKNENGIFKELEMPTTGLRDTCAMTRAPLACDSELTAVNTYTPRDLFRFYHVLNHLPENRIRKTSLEILGILPNGISRGYFKNLASRLGVRSMSKNGRAEYSGKAIVTDAGILHYQGKSYVIVTLSYNAVETMETLYGSYLAGGIPASEEKSLIQLLLDGELPPDEE